MLTDDLNPALLTPVGHSRPVQEPEQPALHRWCQRSDTIKTTSVFSMCYRLSWKLS